MHTVSLNNDRLEACRFLFFMAKWFHSLIITVNPLLSNLTCHSTTILSWSDNTCVCVNRGQIWRPSNSHPGWSTTVPLLSFLTPSSASRSKRSSSSSLQWKYGSCSNFFFFLKLQDIKAWLSSDYRYWSTVHLILHYLLPMQHTIYDTLLAFVWVQATE